MAHFARIDDDGTVCEVIVIDNSVLTDDGTEEALGQAYIAEIGLEGTWIQTSYTSSFRGRFAGVGMTWNGTEFVQPTTTEEA